MLVIYGFTKHLFRVPENWHWENLDHQIHQIPRPCRVKEPTNWIKSFATKTPGPRSSDDWKSFLPKVVPNFRTQIVDDKQTLKRKGHWTCQNPPSLILKQRSKILQRWLKLKTWILKKGGSNPNFKNMGFPTKNDHFEVFWGYHHLRKHPSFFRCFKYFYLVPTIFGYFIFHIPRTHQQTPRPTVNILLDWPAKG